MRGLGADWGSTFPDCSCCWYSENICVTQAPLSALLAALPLSFPGFQRGDSQHELVQCYLKCSSVVCANDPTPFAARVSALAAEVLGRTQPVPPAAPAFPVTPRGLEAEEEEFCTPSVPRGCYAEPGEILSWILIILTVVPRVHSSVLTVPHQMLRASLCPSCGKTPGVRHCMCKGRTQLTAELGVETLGSIILSSNYPTLQGAIPAAITCR